MIYSTAIR